MSTLPYIAAVVFLALAYLLFGRKKKQLSIDDAQQNAWETLSAQGCPECHEQGSEKEPIIIELVLDGEVVKQCICCDTYFRHGRQPIAFKIDNRAP